MNGQDTQSIDHSENSELSLDYPLVVDLDGTLIHSDMLHELTLRVLRDDVLDIFRVPGWLFQGKAILKKNIAKKGTFDPALLPYNQAILDWLSEQRAAGRRLILCTASDQSTARTIADHLGIFDNVMASDGHCNLAGEVKAAALVQQFGAYGFDYVGNSTTDLAVWSHARRAIIVNGKKGLAQKAEKICSIEKIFPTEQSDLSVWLRVLRVHQWLKNLLLAVPLCASHGIDDGSAWLLLLMAFFSFSLCASSVYIANDLLDLESDRQHPRKCKRPFASGKTPVWQGVVLAPILLLTSIIIAFQVNTYFLSLLGGYFALTCLYSWSLKRLVLIDCMTLAILYTLRVIAGTAVVGLDLSFWLLSFSIFLFLSLAYVKRYAELEIQILSGKQKLHGRGYQTTDAPLIQTMGIAASYASVLVLALYLNSDAVVKLYKMPEMIWGAVPVVLFWISWMWIQAYRGKMHDDPLVFAIKDQTSVLTGLVFVAVMLAGTWGLPWLP